MTKRFIDQVAIVSGGSRGIGLETCQAFAQEGAQVVIASVDQKRGFEAEEAITEPEIAKAISATIEDTGEAQIFNIQKKETIPSDKKPHQVLISQITNPLESDFFFCSCC